MVVSGIDPWEELDLSPSDFSVEDFVPFALSYGTFQLMDSLLTLYHLLMLAALVNQGTELQNSDPLALCVAIPVL